MIVLVNQVRKRRMLLFGGALVIAGVPLMQLASRPDTLPVPDVTPATAEIPALAPEDELARVRGIASRSLQNDLGFVEAVFPQGPTMIFVPGGTFRMGNDALGEGGAAPAHKVTLSPYWISKYPVTIGDFRRFVEAESYVTNVELVEHPGPWVYDFEIRGFRPQSGHRWDNAFHQVTERFPELTINESHPAANLSWYDCIAYGNWMADETGLPFTLPSEAEWEFAARGSDGRTYPWGNQEPDGTRANYADETFERYFPGTEQSIVHQGVDDGFAITSPVGSFPAGRSPFGGLDMAGNLTEWVFDGDYDYSAEAQIDPIQLTSSGIRMQKAGFWAGSAGRFNATPDEIEHGHNIRSDARQGDDPASADDHLGCRLAVSYTPRR